MDVRASIFTSPAYNDKASSFIGLERIRVGSTSSKKEDHKIIENIGKYRELFNLLIERGKNTEPDKYLKVLHEMLRCLGEIEALGAKKGKDYSLDILQALRELYVALSNPEHKPDAKSLKTFWNEISKKESSKEIEAIKSVYRMVSYGYTPYMMKDTLDGIFALEQVKHLKSPSIGESKSHQILVKELEGPNRLNQKINFLNQLINAESLTHVITRPHVFKKTAKPGIFIHSPQSERKGRLVAAQAEQKEIEEQAKREVEPHLVQAFCDCERVIQQAKQILHDPEFQLLDRHTQEHLTEQLNQIIVDNLAMMERLYKRSETLKTKLHEDQKMYAMSEKIMGKIAKHFGSLTKYGNMLREDASPNRQASTSALQDALNEGEPNRYEVKNLAGGNSNVYLIKDTTDGSVIVFRERELLTAEIEENLSSEQLRLQVTNSLSLAPTVTQVYVLAPLRGDDMGNPYFGFSVQTLELSEPVTGGNFFGIMQQARNEYMQNPSPEKLKEMQLTFLNLALQTIEMTAYFESKDRLFTDLKGKNLLMSEAGLLKVSDAKAFVPIGPEIHNPLQVTPGFVDARVMEPPKGRVESENERINRLHKLEKEALVSTLWQMARDVEKIPGQKDEKFADLYTQFLQFLNTKTDPILQGEFGKIVHQVLYGAYSATTITGLLKQMREQHPEIIDAVIAFRQEKKKAQVSPKVGFLH